MGLLMNGARSVGWGWMVKVPKSQPELSGFYLTGKRGARKGNEAGRQDSCPVAWGFCASANQQNNRIQAALFT